MGKLTGSILLFAGIALATSTLASQQRTADVAAPRAPAVAAAPVAPDSAKGEAKPAEPSAPPLPPAPALAPPTEKTAEPKPPLARKFIPAPPAVRIAEAPPRVPASQSEPANPAPLNHAALTREIQRQLKRVGCYGGAITGVWSPSVRRAMKAFTDRANASLPVDEPDQVLLAMVQNHQDVACSASCPPGQGAAEDGRCLPEALVARARKRPAAPPAPPAAPAKALEDAPSAVASAPAAPASRPMGRMSLAGPRSEPSPSIKGPARARPPNIGAPRPTRRTRSQRAPRYADTPIRERRRDMRAYSGSPGYPWWALRAFLP